MKYSKFLGNMVKSQGILKKDENSIWNPLLNIKN